jgi:hypothetical protein
MRRQKFLIEERLKKQMEQDMKFERKENRKEEMRLKVSTQTGSPSWS